MIHRSILDKVGLFDESLIICEDYDLWLRILINNEIGLIDEYLLLKQGGRTDQLSCIAWGIDKFHIQSLEKILLEISCIEKKEQIVQMLLFKISIMLKGAKKHKNNVILKTYNSKLEKYKTFNYR